MPLFFQKSYKIVRVVDFIEGPALILGSRYAALLSTE